MAICHPERAHHARGLCSRCAAKAYSAAHPAQRKASYTKWVAKHPGYYKAYAKAKYAADPVGRRKMVRDWEATHPERVRAFRSLRNTRESPLGVRFFTMMDLAVANGLSGSIENGVPTLGCRLEVWANSADFKKAQWAHEYMLRYVIWRTTLDKPVRRSPLLLPEPVIDTPPIEEVP
jgi:hypothetical protein